MESVKESLKGKILLVFADVPAPAEDEIIEHDCEKCYELQETFKGKDWRTLPGELIEKHFSNLPLFSPMAFRYFLPAYLVHSLDHFNSDSWVAEYTAYSLAPDKEKPGSDSETWQALRYKFFTAEQLDLLCEFSEMVEQYEDENQDNICDKTLIRRGRERMKKYWKLGQEIKLRD